MRRIIPSASQAVLYLVAAVSLASCRATSTAYRFTPSPAEVLVTQSSDTPALARVLVGVIGAEREGARSSGMPELLVRLRIENRSDEELSFDPARSVVYGSDLAEFGAAKGEFNGPIAIAARRSESLLLRYPFPSNGSLEAPRLTGVNLQFELDLEESAARGEAVEVSVTLERDEIMTGRNFRNTTIIYPASVAAGGQASAQDSASASPAATTAAGSNRQLTPPQSERQNEKRPASPSTRRALS